jgi:hypothetical protein
MTILSKLPEPGEATPGSGSALACAVVQRW